MNLALQIPERSFRREGGRTLLVVTTLLLALGAWVGVGGTQQGGEEIDPGAEEGTRTAKVQETQEKDHQQADLESQRRARRGPSSDPREQAIDALLDQIEKEPENAVLRYQLGNAYQEAGYLHSALEQFNESVRIDAGSSRAWNNRGSVLKDLNRHDQAIESFEKALEIDPADVMAQVNLGDEYLLQKRYQQAVDLYRRAIEIDPESVNAYYSLAISFAETGMYRDAARAWRKAAEFDQAARGEDSDVAKRALENAKLMEEIVADAVKQVEERERIRQELQSGEQGKTEQHPDERSVDQPKKKSD